LSRFGGKGRTRRKVQRLAVGKGQAEQGIVNASCFVIIEAGLPEVDLERLLKVCLEECESRRTRPRQRENRAIETAAQNQNALGGIGASQSLATSSSRWLSLRRSCSEPAFVCAVRGGTHARFTSKDDSAQALPAATIPVRDVKTQDISIRSRSLDQETEHIPPTGLLKCNEELPGKYRSSIILQRISISRKKLHRISHRF
jgi:hypothetical protein